MPGAYGGRTNLFLYSTTTRYDVGKGAQFAAYRLLNLCSVLARFRNELLSGASWNQKKEMQLQRFSERNRITDHFADLQLFLCRSAPLALPAVRGTPLLLTDR